MNSGQNEIIVSSLRGILPELGIAIICLGGLTTNILPNVKFK